MIILQAGIKNTMAGSIIELVVLLIVFVLVLFASYYVTKWIAKKGMPGNRAVNIELKESFRLNQNKTISILRVGKKYIVVGITRDHFEFLCEVSEDELDFSPPSGEKPGDVTFKDIMAQVLKGQKGKK